MGKIKEENIIGTRQGIFDVLYECDFKSNDGHRMFHVKCSKCGWETNMQMHQTKYTKACNHINVAGQYISDMAKLEWSNKRLYSIYRGIIQRCYNHNEKSYRWYGGKGVKLCEEWLKEPLSFEIWALNNGYKDNLTIDRIDSEKDYSPDNCRWSTALDNAKYKSTTRVLEVDDVAYTGREWADVLDIGTNTVNLMLRQYPKEKVKEFIRRRIKEPNKNRAPKQSWMSVYGL